MYGDQSEEFVFVSIVELLSSTIDTNTKKKGLKRVKGNERKMELKEVPNCSIPCY